jgi:hypothetical protein
VNKPAEHRTKTMVRSGEVSIETFVEGEGPAFVILPSYGRDSDKDFDPITSSLVDAAWTVLGPRPRSIGSSCRPMQFGTPRKTPNDCSSLKIWIFSDIRHFAPGTHRGILLVRLSNPSRRHLVERRRGIFLALYIERGVKPRRIAQAYAVGRAHRR